MLVSAKTEDSGPLQAANSCNGTLLDNRYVFCNDEVTFYSPGMVIEDDEISHEDDVKVTNIQIQIDSTNLQNDECDYFDGCSGLEKEKMPEQENKILESSTTIPDGSQGIYLYLF